MKLFLRLVISFSMLIIFQTLMTGIFVANTIRNNNLADARTELRREADFISSNFSSWKRHIWKQLIRIRSRSDDGNARGSAYQQLNSFLIASSIDAVIVKNGDESFSIESISTTEDFILPPAEPLEVLYPHPYIRLHRIGDQLYLMGTVTLEIGGGQETVYLIKHINESFLRNIVFDTGGRVLFHAGGTVLAGNFDHPRIIAEAAEIDPYSAYVEQYDLSFRDQTWNIATGKCGLAGPETAPEVIYLSTVLSNQPYLRRIRTIEQTVITVSLVTMLITALLSLLISRGITRPVTELAAAMARLRTGGRDVRIDADRPDEIGVLMHGFNAMAARLSRDQEEIEASLGEITFLNHFNERILNSIRDAIAVVDEEERIEKANRFFSALFPGTERIGDLPFDPHLLTEIRQVIDGSRESREVRFRYSEERIYQLKVYPLHRDRVDERNLTVLLLEDISERTAWEENLFRTEKLSTISILSAGIAHEINNPLSSILTNIQNAVVDLEDPRRVETLRLVEGEANRIARIIQELLDFTSPEHPGPSATDPVATAREVVHLVRHSRRPGGKAIPPIEVSAPADADKVRIPRTELMQIYINLLQNAIRATDDDRAIELSLGPAERSGYVRLAVTDSGCGIEEAHIKRVFDPFFTTRRNGEGTGLGLSVVYGMITKHGGSIEIRSEIGRGTEVIFELPAAEV